MTVKVDGHFINADYSAAEQLKMVEAFSMWGRLQRDSEFLALLNMISHGNGVKSKILDIPVGGTFQDTFSLHADTTIGAAGTTITLTIDSASDPHFVPGDTVKVIDTNGNNHIAMLRTTGTAVVSGGVASYANVQVLTNTDAGHVYAAATTEAYVLGSAYEYDNTAPLPSDEIPGKVRNVMQDFRKSFAKGRREMSDTLLFNQGIDHLSQVEMSKFMKKFANSILFNEDYVLPNSEDYGVAKGLLGFIKDGGKKLITPAASFSYRKLLDFFSQFDKGSNDKVLVASPSVVNLFLDTFRGIINVQKDTIKIPDTPIIWTGMTADFAYGRLTLIPDRSFNGKSIYLNDGTNDFVGKDYAMFVDIEHTRMAYLDVEGEGVKTIGVKPVSLANNDTREQREIETIATLVVDDAETNGIIAFS